MVLAAYEYVEVRGSGSQSTSRPWPVTSSEWSGHGWTRCWSGRLPWRPLPPMHEATGAVASPLMPTRTGYGAPQLPHRPQHKPRPEQTNPSRLTALTPQNQPERPLLRGNQYWHSVPWRGGGLPTTALSKRVSKEHWSELTALASGQSWRRRSMLLSSAAIPRSPCSVFGTDPAMRTSARQPNDEEVPQRCVDRMDAVPVPSPIHTRS